MSSPNLAALVTGGARRVGRAIVEDLAANGWSVAIHYNHSRDEAELVASGIRQRGGKAAVVTGDLNDSNCHADIIAKASAAVGTLTLLVNNASIFEKDAFGALQREQWDRQMAINLASPVFLAQAFAAALPADMEANIVNLLDQRIWHPSPAYFSYQLTKSALAVATETMALALAPRVRVNGIAPGPVLPSAKATPESFARLVDSVPLKRAADLSDFGRTIRYLAAARSITGQVIALDSGQHLG